MATSRITNKDVRRAMVRHGECLQKCGIPLREGTRLHLSEGSPSAGRAWRIHAESVDSGALWSPPIGGDYLGWTAREAYETLVGRTGTIYDVHHALRSDSEAG